MALSILLLLALGTDAILPAIFEVVYIIGLWKVFTKCGLPGWRALIPFYREYSHCSDGRNTGKAYRRSEGSRISSAISCSR